MQINSSHQLFNYVYGNLLSPLWKRFLITSKKLYCRTPFVEQLFAEQLLVEHVSMAASIK